MTLLIKKYKNRRLYDTEKSRYITVEQLQRYVIDGIDFQVLDAASNADITAPTLLQILVEMEAGANPLLSANMLRQLICLAQHPMHQAIKHRLNDMMSFIDTQAQSKQVSEAWDQWMKQWQVFK
jgi:polyhydroxyalkanoate synthesis repressor PhaR